MRRVSREGLSLLQKAYGAGQEAAHISAEHLPENSIRTGVRFKMGKGQENIFGSASTVRHMRSASNRCGSYHSA